MRIGCLWIPDLPLQALLRADPSLHGKALAVAEGEGARARIVGVSTLARTQGVAPGQRVKEALAFCPELLLRWDDPQMREAAREAAIDAAAAVSPQVEEISPGLVLLGVTGLERLHGGERGIASALLAAAGKVGLEGRASIASGKQIARIAAIRREGIEVVSKGEGRAFLAPLPLAALGASQELVETLSRWGIATAGEFASLPGSGIASRLGRDGLALHGLASGIDKEPLIPREEPEVFEEGCDLDHEIVALEGLLFLLRPALERLTSRLSCRGLSCGGLVMRLALDPVGEAILPVEVAAPTRDISTLLSLCRSILERKPPGAPIRGLRIRAQGAGGRVEQLRLFGLPTVSPEKLATAISKVAAIVGDGRLGSPLPLDSHQHEAFGLQRFDPPPPRDRGEITPRERMSALRLFRPPLPAEVRVAGGAPEAIRAGGVAGWVVSMAGPWRLDVGWAETPLQRDGFDVELSDGAVYRLGRDLAGGRWFLLGRYD